MLGASEGGGGDIWITGGGQGYSDMQGCHVVDRVEIPGSSETSMSLLQPATTSKPVCANTIICGGRECPFSF